MRQPLRGGGAMGPASYALRGTRKGRAGTFGRASPGAGRRTSRRQAKKRWRGGDIVRGLAGRGSVVRAHGRGGVAEEAPGAYKDVETVAGIMDTAGINRKVARLRPIVCIKG